MAIIRNKEFDAFLLDGKTRRYGALLMEGNCVYSYDKLIARVNRKFKYVIYDYNFYSHTSNIHLKAIKDSQSKYVLAPVLAIELSKTFRTIYKNYFKIPFKNTKHAIKVYNFYSMLCALSIGYDIDIIHKFAEASEEEQDSMIAYYELMHENFTST